MRGRRSGKRDRSVRRDRGVDPESPVRFDVAEVEAACGAAVGGDDPVGGWCAVVATREKWFSIRHPDRTEDIDIDRGRDFFSVAAPPGRDPDRIAILAHA